MEWSCWSFQGKQVQWITPWAIWPLWSRPDQLNQIQVWHLPIITIFNIWSHWPMLTFWLIAVEMIVQIIVQIMHPKILYSKKIKYGVMPLLHFMKRSTVTSSGESILKNMCFIYQCVLISQTNTGLLAHMYTKGHRHKSPLEKQPYQFDRHPLGKFKWGNNPIALLDHSVVVSLLVWLR